MKQVVGMLTDVEFCEGASRAAEGADAVAIVNEWNEFRALDLRRLKSIVKQPVLVDPRNIYERKDGEMFGYKYVRVGK